MIPAREAAARALTDLLFDDAAAGRCLVAPDGTIVRANAEFLRATGMERDDVLGRELGELWPEARDAARAIHARASEGERVAFRRHAHRMAGRETLWEGTVAPVPMESWIGLLVTVREVAGRTFPPRPRGAPCRAASCGPIFDVINDAVFIHDVETGAILDVNRRAEEMWGASRDEICSTTFEALSEGSPPDRQGDAVAFLRAAAAGVPQLFEWRSRDRSGRLFWVEVNIKRVALEHCERLVAVVRDITERKRAEEALQAANAQLRDADRRKDEFLGVLSHELRNPLAPIRNSIFLLDHAQGDPARAARARDVIRRQAEHLTRLVDDLLDVTRVSRGKVELQRTRFDLREVVRRTCDDHQSAFEQAGLEMRLDLPFGPVWVDADATRMSQVIGNLLHNAVKFTPAGGRVEVSVAAEGDRAEIAVRDTGAGIDPADVARMFEPFAQGAQDLARTRGGLGLGLALVKGLVELHGGAVRAHSEGPGRGTLFVVQLPAAAPDPVTEAASPAACPAGGRTVLIIEDNADAGDSLADVLEMAGHHVRLARDGRTGLAMARADRPEVVLCDVGLPDMSGYDIARVLRGEDASRATRLVALTGYTQPEDKRRAADAGFDAHLGKPPPIDELHALIAGDR